MKDLSAISERTGVAVWELKHAIGLPLEVCTATTTKEAQLLWVKATESTEKNWSILVRWLELCTTIDDIYCFCGATCAGGEIGQMADAKWEEIVRTTAAAITDLDEAIALWERTVGGSKAEFAAILRIYELSPEEEKQE